MALAGTLLSESSGGRAILVTATASTGTLLHQTDVSSTVYHRIYLFATNNSTASATVTVEWGGTSSGDRIAQTVPATIGMLPIGLPNGGLAGTGAAARSVRAYASAANVISLSGWVNKHSTSGPL